MRPFASRRVRALAVVALAAIAIAAGAVSLARGGSADTSTAAAGAAPTATATIERRDLVEIDTEDGTLGYAGTRSVANRLPGTVTWLPPAGRVVRPDRALYKVDDMPVILMDGRVPAYRALAPGTPDGADVRQLERSLRAAGYDPGREIAVDRSWDAGTTAAVERWQRAHGLVQSGAIELGRVVFLPGRRRIATIGATVGQALSAGPAGAPPGDAFMATTSTRRQVTVALDTSASTLARKGARVTVVLPSGAKVGGRISSVGKVATTPPSQDPSGASAADPTDATIEVTIRLRSRESTFDQAPVTVRFERSRRKEVLAVPVTALLARPGGEFAVGLVEASGRRRVVSVRPGLYAGGYVEIAAAELRPGQRVTNAAVQ